MYLQVKKEVLGVTPEDTGCQVKNDKINML